MHFYHERSETKKLLRVMRLTAIILLAACLQVSARTQGQTVTLKVKDAPMKTVFKEIQKQKHFCTGRFGLVQGIAFSLQIHPAGTHLSLHY